MTHKTCSSCKESKLLSAFTNDKSKKDGKRSRCRACQREWNKTHGERKRETQRKYAAKPLSRFKKYQASAESRGFDWELTFEDFMVHWQANCTHCDTKIATIGLDRVDSSLPYQVNNIEPACSKCNQMKSDWATVDWYNHMELIRKNARGFVSGAKKY